MDNYNKLEMDDTEKKHANTEYVPTKCRITKPPPPKPATNPLQFVKISMCPLTKKAQEQIKKVEETKTVKKEVREEPEDWQANLDNWKSSRRKRQEQIIERVVEVKKLEQEEQGRGRRKSKTFSEMMGDRRHKFTLPIYDDDSNDLSDYGIGSSSSKTNSVKDVDTDDNSSLLDEKDHNVYESSSKDTSSASNQSQSEDETHSNGNATKISKYSSSVINTNINIKNNNNNNSTYKSTHNSFPLKSASETRISKLNTEIKEEPEQYTYEGAIQNYRSRIKSKINIDESVFNKPQEYTKSKEFTEAQSLLPKGNLFKRKEMFEVEIGHLDSPNTRRLSEEFANTQSIKDRLKSLEQFTEQPIKTADKQGNQIKSVKERLEVFNKLNDNNNTKNAFKPLRECVSHNNINKISNYLLDKSNSNSSLETRNIRNDWSIKDEISDRSSSPEAELYMNKLNIFSRDLDNLMYGKTSHNLDNDLDYVRHSHYTASTSSNEHTGLSSDREDSGIHTADVSCSVSQADEPFDDNELPSNTIPNCIEKLKTGETEKKQLIDSVNNNLLHQPKPTKEAKLPLDYLMDNTGKFINEERKHAEYNLTLKLEPDIPVETAQLNITNESNLSKETPSQIVPEFPIPIIYENVEIKPFSVDFITEDLFSNPALSLAPPKYVQPPKEKPPPPPPTDTIEEPESNLKRLNSTKRIKKEIQIKRSSFLGLDDSIDDQLDPDLIIDKPPDIKSFLQKESNLDKSLYRKLQGSREGGFSEVESQDSGLEIERGRLSSDTWCSSIIDSSTPDHNRQDSGQTNSFTSEEEEIMKKEREIIEMIEKEEKSRDGDFLNHNYQNATPLYQNTHYISDVCYNNDLGSDKFDKPFSPQDANYGENFDDQDSEVLKVEHELLQLEREELERKRENIMFRENQAKIRQQNRYSLENICDNVEKYPQYSDYRKSMPELQCMSNDFRKSMPDVPSYIPPPNNYNLQYHKSMPDIQHAYNKSADYHNVPPESNLTLMDHQNSMPELQHELHKNIYRSPINRQPIMPGKPLRPLKDQRDKDILIMMKPIESEAVHHYNPKMRSISGHNIHALAATPKSRHIENWIQPKANPEIKSYNQHWLIQEAELRRLSEQNNPRRNWHQNRPEKHIPEPIIQSLTQRVHNRTNINDRNQLRDLRQSPNKEFVQHPYLDHPQTMGHALPMSYPPTIHMEETQDKVLSVSGKKKCSYCNNELGRGAAMIIESLCLFYHMECFKCCVCHLQLGDGLMGTDVRVRNQKLHCHNCYSSDDGVKFSCV